MQPLHISWRIRMLNPSWSVGFRYFRSLIWKFRIRKEHKIWWMITSIDFSTKKNEFHIDYSVQSKSSWHVDFVKYLASQVIPPDLSYQQKKKFFSDLSHYYWDEHQLFERGVSGIFQRWISEEEMESVITHFHAFTYVEHASTLKTSAKIHYVGLYWPSLFKDMHLFIKKYDQYQHTRNIFKKNDMPLENILEIEIFMLRAFTLWGRFPLTWEFSIYLWWSIIFSNGLRQLILQ